MDEQISQHQDPHFDPLSGLCQCGCEDCTLRLIRHCVCEDCPCDSQEDHSG